MARPLPDPLLRIADEQFGLVSRSQALEVFSRGQLGRRVDAGLLVVAGRGVYRLAAAPVIWRQRAIAACMEVGGQVAVSHRAAAHAWRATELVRPEVELTIPSRRRVRLGGTILHRRPLPDVDVVRRWGIPVTSAARTVIDLSTVLPAGLLLRVTDELLRRRQLQLSDLTCRLESGAPLPRFSRHGVEEILLRRTGGVGDSPPEDWVFDSLVRAGLPAPERHYRLDIGGVVREVDLAYPIWRIAIDYGRLERPPRCRSLPRRPRTAG